MKMLPALASALLASTAQAQVCPCPCPPGADHAAYELKVPVDASATVTTAAGTGNLDLIRARRLHAPLAPQPLDGPHFVGYEVDGSVPAPGAVVLNTAIGQVTGDATKTKWLVVPANKSLVSPPPAPGDQPAWVCFSGSLKGPKPDLATTDQFGSQLSALHRVETVCAPATLDGSAPPPGPWRVCFSAKPKPPVQPGVVFVTTIFQSFEYDLEPVDEICVSATPA